MKLKYNNRSTEWLKKGVPGQISSIDLVLNGNEIRLDEYQDIELDKAENLIGANIKLENGDILQIKPQQFTVDKDMQLHLLFANKNYKLLNTLVNPLGLGLMVIGAVLAALIPAFGAVILLAGVVALTVTPNTFIYKKYGADGFKVLLT